MSPRPVNCSKACLSSDRGLTLLELLGLLGVIAILAAILVPNFIRARPQGNGMYCKSNLKNIGTALEMYSTKHEGQYPRNLNQITPEYLKTIPTCPTADSDTYTPSYGTGATAYNATLGYNDYYIVFCAGSSHTALSVPANYPQYDGLRGLYER